MEDWYGRLVAVKNLPEEVAHLAQALESFVSVNGKLVCHRCGLALDKETLLPTGAYYCRGCLVFGRNQTDKPLYAIPQQPFPTCSPLNWSGKLTAYQEEISAKLLEALEEKQNLLVHAVTGAGKTEMIYQPVAKILATGGSVALVSPRIDVCNELYQRFSRDFTCKTVLLHSESEPYSRAPLVIATVHQLFKFYQAFDVIVIDEVDAFPFVDNDQLYQAVANALKPDGVTFFLTATSTEQLEKQVKRGDLAIAHLARRFHGNPLVVPKPVWLSGLLDKLAKKHLPRKLIKQIQDQRQTGFPLLIFFPHIELGEDLAKVLAHYFPAERIGFVSSQTANRIELVEQFRKGDLSVLVSTTILERGVTFPKVDVFVLWANHKLYTKLSLVQIAGRVGRSKDRPTGQLLFFHDGLTLAITKAVSEIRLMNQKGGF